MLDYLVREEIFVPSLGSQRTKGLKRRYTYQDVVLLRTLHEICVRKGKISHLRDALNQFRSEFGSLLPGQRVDQKLFVERNQLHVYTGSQSGRQLRTGQMTFAFIADLSTISKELARCIRFEPRSGDVSLIPELASKAEEERQRIWGPIKARRESK